MAENSKNAWRVHCPISPIPTTYTWPFTFQPPTALCNEYHNVNAKCAKEVWCCNHNDRENTNRIFLRLGVILKSNNNKALNIAVMQLHIKALTTIMWTDSPGLCTVTHLHTFSMIVDIRLCCFLILCIKFNCFRYILGWCFSLVIAIQFYGNKFSFLLLQQSSPMISLFLLWWKILWSALAVIWPDCYSDTSSDVWSWKEMNTIEM